MARQMSEASKKYLREYKKNNLKRIPLEVSHDFYIKIQQTAALSQKSVNGFIKDAISDAIAKYEREHPTSKESNEKLAKMRGHLINFGGGANNSNT